MSSFLIPTFLIHVSIYTVDLYFAGIYTREQALDQLRFKRPNHQLCITNQQVLEKHLHFIESIKLL